MSQTPKMKSIKLFEGILQCPSFRAFMAASCLITVLAAAGTRASADSVTAAQAQRIVSQYSASFTSPGSSGSNEAPNGGALLGNGNLGVVIVNPINTMTFLLGKNEFWSLNGGQVEPMASMALSIPGMSGASFAMQENIYTGTVTGQFSLNGNKIQTTSWVSSNDTTNNFLFTQFTYSGSGTQAVTVSMAVIPGNNYPASSGSSGGVLYFNVAADNTATVGGYNTRQVRVAAGVVGATGTISGNTLQFTLSPGVTVTLVSSIMSNYDSSSYTTQSISNVSGSTASSISSELAADAAWWSNFWSVSYVEFNNPVLQKEYYGSLYLLASSSEPNTAPPGLWGPWVEANPAWAGDYTLDYNYQTPPLAEFPTNHVALAASYDGPVITWLPKAEAYATSNGFTGALYPAHIGPLPNGSYETGSGTLNIKSNGAFTATIMLEHYYMTQSAAYAASIWPMISESATFYQNYLTWNGTSYDDLNDSQVENDPYPQTNGTMSLGFIRNLFQGAINLSTVLGQSSSQRSAWQHVLDNLTTYNGLTSTTGGLPYPTFTKNGLQVFANEQVGDQWAVNGDEVWGITTASAVGLGSSPTLLTIARNTIQVLGPGALQVMWYPAAARVGYSASTILSDLTGFVNNHAEPSLYVNVNGGGIENQALVPATISEMLMQSFQGNIILFPNWPSNTNAHFGDNLAYGNFLVSSAIDNNAVLYARIISQAGQTLSITNPWSGQSAQFYRNGTNEGTLSGTTFSIPTSTNDVLMLAPSGTSLATINTEMANSLAQLGGNGGPGSVLPYNVNAIYTNGTTFSSTGGADGVGNAYSATLLGATQAFNGTTFTYGLANAPDAFTNVTVALAPGSFSSLNILAYAINSDQASQTFQVNYTNNTYSTATQSISDWGIPGNYSGETKVATMAYRNTASGGENNGTTTYLYGYTIPVTSGLTVESITLPANNNVIVLGIQDAATSATEGSYSGTPTTIPGTVQAENYDTGGQGVAYNVTSINGQDPGYRSDSVDLENTADAGGGDDLGWTSAGQWFKYTVNVATAGTYTVSLRVASATAVGTNAGSLHLQTPSGTNLSGAINIPGTGGWQTWTTITANVTLPAGQQVIELLQDTGGYNLNYMTFASAGGTVAAPSLSPAGGTYTSAQNVTISDATSGASIRYTTDGSTPTETNGTIYSGPVNIGVTTTLKAIAYESGSTDSPIVSGTYTINILQVAAPSFSPVAGTYTSAQAVTISTTTSGASIRYTTDGSTPTETNGTVYSGPVSIGVTTTLKAIAYESGFIDSSITSATYTITSGSGSCVTATAGGGWQNAVMTSQTGTFTATFDATPSASPTNAVVALSNGAQTAYASFACLARFNTSGQIDAYNGTAYGASTIPYSANVAYHFRLVVNVTAQTYSVYVTPAGGSELTVGLNYNFRLPATTLNYWGAYVNATGTATVTVCNFSTGGGLAPVISSPGTASGTVGAAFSYQITASNTPTSYAATGLPAGLSVNASTGLISGTPTTAGTSSVTLSATNASGTGNQALTLTVTQQAANPWELVGAADFNGDGKSDLIWQNTASGQRAIWLMNSTTNVSSVSLGTVTTDWDIAGAADFNGDGKPDLIWQNMVNGQRAIWLMNGTTYVSSVSLGTVTPDWQIAGAADFNKNGNSDLIWQNTKNGQRAIWLMNGTTYVSSVSLGTVTTDWQIAGAADFNGDGNSDLIWQNTANGQRAIWLMNGTTYVSTVSLGTVTTNWNLVGAADFNGDGKPDLIWQDTASNQYAFWLMNGTTYVSSVAYTLGLPQLIAPSFSPAGGTYTSAQNVTISDTTSSASIRYTTDGSTPSETNGTLYSGPVNIGSTTTLKAIAYANGYGDSPVASATYTIISGSTVAPPTFNPPGGTYTSAQNVTIASTTGGASIRYTTDGSTPSETAGTVYSGPVNISSTTTLNAIAYKSGSSDSTITSAIYTLTTSSPPAAVGATTPFVSYEAEAGTLGGGATVVALTAPPTTQYASPVLEASGHAYVQLTGTGQYVQWTNNTGQNITAINLRSSIPDAPTGGGITSTIDLYVDGVFRQAFSVNSQQNYCYEGLNYNDQTDKNPADGNPRFFWNDTHAFITGAPVAPGSTIRFQRDPANTAAFYYIDVVDVENPPPALVQPANSLSIVSYGAVANDSSVDNTSAINNCFSAAQSQGKTAWIPAGTFYFSAIHGGLHASGITITGAGPWYSTLYRFTPANNTQGVANIIEATSTVLENVLLDCNGVSRAGNNNDGAVDFSGSNWLVNNVWIQHVTSSFWCAGDNGMAENCRTLSVWSDGGNFNNVQDSRGIGTNLTYFNNFVRGTGDDAMAINSVHNNGATVLTMMSNITYENNTAVAPWGGKGIGIYGGSNITVKNNLLCDTARYLGLGVMKFGVNGSDLLSATVTGNTVLRCGGNGYNQQQQAMMIGNGGDGQGVGTIENAYVGSNTITNALYDAIGFSSSLNIVLEDNTINSPGLDGIAFGNRTLDLGTVSGDAILLNNTVNNLNSGRTAVALQSGTSYQVYTPILAASYNNALGVQTENCSEGGLDVGSISNGSYTLYNQVNLNGIVTFIARVASAGSGGNIEIRLDSPTGPLIGTSAVPATGGWQTWTDTQCTLSGASGIHNVYLVYTGGNGNLFNVQWFALTQLQSI